VHISKSYSLVHALRAVRLRRRRHRQINNTTTAYPHSRLHAKLPNAPDYRPTRPAISDNGPLLPERSAQCHIRFRSALCVQMSGDDEYAKVGLAARGEQLKGKWCLVTGASRGVGWQIAEKLASEGANLILVARSEDKLEKVCSQVTPIRRLVVVFRVSSGSGVCVHIEARAFARHLRGLQRTCPACMQHTSDVDAFQAILPANRPFINF